MTALRFWNSWSPASLLGAQRLGLGALVETETGGHLGAQVVLAQLVDPGFDDEAHPEGLSGERR
ncbi:hypothetical protein [Pseudonocardia sp. N23]|uniref:hypothetical protein n=1 Tax=Pseudonocardia sp. N23 TaxID=1987376 RepID=UPI000BFB8684|nr:hypothetical protein [Pseudonocardia sp. N23]